MKKLKILSHPHLFKSNFRNPHTQIRQKIAQKKKHLSISSKSHFAQKYIFQPDNDPLVKLKKIQVFRDFLKIFIYRILKKAIISPDMAPINLNWEKSKLKYLEQRVNLQNELTIKNKKAKKEK